VIDLAGDSLRRTRPTPTMTERHHWNQQTGDRAPEPSGPTMPVQLVSIAHLLLAIALLQLGSGLQGLLIPVRGQLAGFPTYVIGLLGTAYYFGFLGGCVAVPAIIRRVGHIRAFSGFAATAAAAFLVHQLLANVPLWLALRVAVGVCFAGIYMSTESWLNERATVETRGRLLAAYMIVTWIAIIGGKLVFAVSDPAGLPSFTIVSLAICLAVVPVAFTTGAAPVPPPIGRLRFQELYSLSPIGVVGCLFIGAANGAFWTLTPVYAGGHGLSTAQIGVFVAVAVLGGALAQWPIGRISDLTDRRRVLGLSSCAAAASAMALVLFDSSDEVLLILLGLVFGAAALPLYALCLAHANDQAPADSFVEVSSDLLMMFSIGAVAGPFLAALLMDAAGTSALFMFTAAVHLSLAALTAVRVWQVAPVPPEEKEASVPSAPGTTQAMLPLDPRATISEPAEGTAVSRGGGR
jgi:MFS family permease